MESTIEKLNSNRLLELNDQDYENIANNDELRSLLITKIKEGHEFSFYDASDLLEDVLYDKDLLRICLLQMKKEEPEEFLQFHFAEFDEAAEQFPPETIEIVKEVIADTFDENIEILKTSEDLNMPISNTKIINIIIENKLEKLYGCIKLDNPPKEIEDLIIEGILNNTYKKIYTITDSIVKACQETDQLSAISYNIDPNNEEYSEIIITALDEGKIRYEDISYNFLEKHKSDLRVLKQKIRNSDHCYFEKEELERKEVQDLIIEEMTRTPALLENWSIKNACEENARLLIEATRLWKVENTVKLFEYGTLTRVEFTPEQRVEFIEAVIYSLSKDLSKIEEFFDKLYHAKHYYPETFNPLLEDNKLYEFLIPRIPIEKVLHQFVRYQWNGYNDEKHFISEKDFKLLESCTITMHEVPKDFNYKVNYPTNIWLAVISAIKPDQLVEENIKLERFVQYPEILDAIFNKLKEFKSNRYNSTIEYWNGPITPNMIEIICDPENPLNLSTTQRLKIIPDSKMIHSNHIYEILNQAENVDYMTLNILFPKLMSMEDLEQVRKISKLLFEKLIFEEREIRYLSSTTDDIVHSLSQTPDGEKSSVPEQSIAIYEVLEEYLKTRNNIPLRLTKNFSEDTRQKATYSNLEALNTNPDFFFVTNSLPHDFTDFIKDAMEQNVPINFKVLYVLANESVNLEFYNYDNVTFFDDEKTYEMLYKILNKAQVANDKNGPRRKIINKWIKEHLTYKFFDCQTEGKTKDLLELIVMIDEYTEDILSAISADKINDGTVLSYKTLEMLLNPNKTEKTNKIIFELIKQNKIDNLKSDNNLSSYINLIDDPIFVDYVKRTFISNIRNNQYSVSILLSSTKYKEATLEELKKNPNMVLESPVVELISKHAELKEIVKASLEQNTNSWLNFKKEFFDKELLIAYLKNHSAESVITYIIHNMDLSPITNEINELIKTTYLEEHQDYNKETYEVLEQFFGVQLLLLLQTENVKLLLKQTPDKAKQFVEIFKTRSLDLSIVTSINDSFQQNRFSIENADVINFFTNTLEKIQRGITEEEIQEVIQTVIQYLPNNLEEEIKKTNNELLLNTYKTNHYEFLVMLIQELANNQNIYAPLFNKITNNLIVQKRNEHRSKQDVYKDTNLTYELETRSLNNALFNYLIKNYPSHLFDMLEILDSANELNFKTLYFLAGDITKYTQEELPSIKRNIPKIKEIFNRYIEMLNERDKTRRSTFSYWDTPVQKQFPNLPNRFDEVLSDESFMKSVKKIPIYPSRTKDSGTISKINMETFLKLCDDPEKYAALVALLNKYRFLEWADIFNPSVEALTVGEDGFNIYNFINAFNQIYENEKRIILRERRKLIETVVNEMRKSGKSEEDIEDYKRVKENEPINIQITPYKILKYSTIYSSIANYYKIILGMEDFELVKRNDPDNAAHANAEDRLEKTSRMQIDMMQFDEITIPSFISEHTVEQTEETTKKIQYIVGNRADSRNLTHGERTGACMRAYGHADDLFTFCNTDPRGFHITFVDPETNEYISRVSGFRNGNTVFLNQLRKSVHPKYSSEEVVEACKQMAQELIDRSKDSDMPIENVVASPCFALYGYETQRLSDDNNIGIGVYTGYKDVTNNAVVLATTGTDGKAVELKLDGENQPTYKPVRLTPREYVGPEITDTTKISLQRINAIKECIENSEDPNYYKLVDFDYEIIETEYIHVIIGQDWYVALDSYGNLTHNIAVQNERSIEELNEALAKMSQIKEERMKLGGFTNGVQ